MLTCIQLHMLSAEIQLTSSQVPLHYTTAVQLHANFSSGFPPSLLFNIKLED